MAVACAACGRWPPRLLDSRLRAIGYVRRVEDALTLAMVHVRSHSRQRQAVVTVMTFARVSMIRPLQNGHTAGRATSCANRESRECITHAGGFVPVRLFNNEQRSPVGSPTIPRSE
jgi:hypothetical protein